MKSRSRSLGGSAPDPAVHYSRVPIPRLIFCMRTESVGREEKRARGREVEEKVEEKFLPED